MDTVNWEHELSTIRISDIYEKWKTLLYGQNARKWRENILW